MNNKLTSWEICYYKRLDAFFKKCNEGDIKKMVDIITKKSKVSLRLLDWYVTQYVKLNDVFYNNVSDKIHYNVHLEYKTQLKLYKKTYFDPFCRLKEGVTNKFNYNYDKKDKNKIISTNIGQLNFFQWAISNKIVDHVEVDIDKISKSMNEFNKLNKKKRRKNVDSDSATEEPDVESKDSIVDNSTYSPEIDSDDEILVHAKKVVVGNKVKIVLSFD